jgi:hypothetical protein
MENTTFRVRQLRLALSKEPNKDVSFPLPEDGKYPVSETLFSIYLEFRTLGKG